MRPLLFILSLLPKCFLEQTLEYKHKIDFLSGGCSQQFIWVFIENSIHERLKFSDYYLTNIVRKCLGVLVNSLCGCTDTDYVTAVATN